MTLLGFLDIFFLILHVTACLVLCGIVLMQGGKGASLSASFGMGAAGSAFGARTDSFITKLTSGAAIAFVITSVSLTFLASKTGSLSQKYEPADEKKGTTLPIESSGQPQEVEKSAVGTETAS